MQVIIKIDDHKEIVNMDDDVEKRGHIDYPIPAPPTVIPRNLNPIENIKYRTIRCELIGYYKRIPVFEFLSKG